MRKPPRSIRIEFYGIARVRAGVRQHDLPLVDAATSLCQVLRRLSTTYPKLAASCFEGDRLRPGFVANVDGEKFVTDEQTPIAAGTTLLITSADAGG